LRSAARYRDLSTARAELLSAEAGMSSSPDEFTMGEDFDPRIDGGGGIDDTPADLVLRDVLTGTMQVRQASCLDAEFMLAPPGRRRDVGVGSRFMKVTVEGESW